MAFFCVIWEKVMGGVGPSRSHEDLLRGQVGACVLLMVIRQTFPCCGLKFQVLDLHRLQHSDTSTLFYQHNLSSISASTTSIRERLSILSLVILVAAFLNPVSGLLRKRETDCGLLTHPDFNCSNGLTCEAE